MSYPIYHCGRCGALFQAPLGHDESRVCGVCKQKPGTGEWPVEGKGGDDGQSSSGSPGAASEAGEGMIHRVPARRRSVNLMAWVIGLWVILMVSALWLHRHHTKLAIEEVEKAGGAADVEREKADLLAAALPECHMALLGYLSAKDAQGQLRHVAGPAGTLLKMEGRHATDAFAQTDVGRLGRVGQELLDVGGEWVLRTRWQEGAEGAGFDAVFRRESEEWLLDWDHFVRYSDYPWNAFLTGEGAEEGEFRLLAREIPGPEETEVRDRKLRFELLSPEGGDHPDGAVASRRFEVNRLSDEGLLLGAAFAARREGIGPFGGAMTPMEPDGLVRLRVVVKRTDFGGVRKFEIVRIAACHWISGDEPGFDLDKLREDAFGPI